jgi:hypothetical protein
VCFPCLDGPFPSDLRRLWLSRACLIAVLALSARSLTVKTHPNASPTDAKEAGYKQVWSRDWATVIKASNAWNSVGSAPGACDKGGSTNTCYATDQAVLPELQTLVRDLSATAPPSQYSKANVAMLSALNTKGQGLSDRDSAFRNQDDALFSRAVDELAVAASQLTTAYEQFPSGDRPTPALFGPGRHAS